MNRQQRRAAAKSQSASGQAGSTIFAAAVQHHQAGRLAEAEACYRTALRAQPDHADAAFNLGVALRAQGKIDDAVAAYAQALRIKPDYPEAHYNLGNALMVAGRAEAAIAAYAQALRLTPGHPRAMANLGMAYSDLGAVLIGQDRLDEADAALAQALNHSPNNAQAHFNRGNLRQRQARFEDAVTAYIAALQCDPNLAVACSNLGNALSALGRREDAMAAHAKAAALHPEEADMHYNLGNSRRDLGLLGAAAKDYARAIALDPRHAKAYGNLAIVRMNQGLLDEAVVAYAKAVELEPGDAGAFSNFLFCGNYDQRLTPAQLCAAHREWDVRFGGAGARPVAYANDRAPDRRLKIGYVSPDFREHSVAYFLEPLLAAHDRSAVEIYCYADVMRPDAMTAQLRQFSDHWRDTVGMTDDALAAQVAADGIDILIDLAGHTAHNRLGVFAAKPAPVQASWLGYPNTTGLSAIDYRIVDAVTDPPGDAGCEASETLLRLPRGFICFNGPENAPAVATPPYLANGFVTFGSFNNPAKLSEATCEVWSRLLLQLPGARLLLKGKAFADPETRDGFLSRFVSRDVDSARVELIAWTPDTASHLALYDRIDIALDPFPYNGTTTTCEALWMGVPVAALRGDRHSARVGASLLTQAGLKDWIGDSVSDYIAIASRLASDPQRLRDLRQSLRPQLAASDLCNGLSFARDFESALRDIWRRRCELPQPL